MECVFNMSSKDLKRMLNNNSIRNTDLTARDYTVLEDIYGRNVHGIRGKQRRMKRKGFVPVKTPLPRALYEVYKDVTLCIDGMYVNRLFFFITYSCHIRFATCHFMANYRRVFTNRVTKDKFVGALQYVNGVY